MNEFGALMKDAENYAALIEDAGRYRALLGFVPDAEHINSLPEPLRRYIHDLETRCDPAGDVRERLCSEWVVAAQNEKIARLSQRIDELEKRP